MHEDAWQHINNCLHCKNPQCVKGCPVKFDIPSFLQQAKQGDFDAAVKTVGHLFGEVCGYICPKQAQCRGNCILSPKGKGVDVGLVEILAFGKAKIQIERCDDALSHLNIAVVGGGVSGITFAQLCYMNGAKVTVYERHRLLHTLRSIPTFRLPSQAADRVEKEVLQSGIHVVQCNVDGEMLQSLQKQYDVVYLATGATVAGRLYAENDFLAVTADEFLRGNFCGKAIIVGGGNTAMDCARLHARRGYPTVVAYRRTLQDMPAFPSEIAAAQGENVQFVFNVAPVSVQKQANGLCVTFAKTLSQGRGQLVLTEERMSINCDVVVSAAGRKFDSLLFDGAKRAEVDVDNCVQGNLFAGGDATGKELAAQAVADAINAANGVLKKYKR